MPAPVPAEKRRDVPSVTRYTRIEYAHIRREAARLGITISAYQRRAALRDSGLLPDTAR